MTVNEYISFMIKIYAFPPINFKSILDILLQLSNVYSLLFKKKLSLIDIRNNFSFLLSQLKIS